MSDEDPGLDRATAASIRGSLERLESQAFQELDRLGVKLFPGSEPDTWMSWLDHSFRYKLMAHGSSRVKEFREELAKLSDEALLSAAYVFEILNFVEWARICLADDDETWHVLAVTLDRLSNVPVEDLVAAWKQAGAQKRGGKTSPKAKAAAVKLLEKLLREDDGLQAKDLWERAGSPTVSRYCHVECEGERYKFAKGKSGSLSILHVDPELGPKRLKSQPFNSTFRRWCKEARENLSTPLTKSPPSSTDGQ